MPVSQYQYGGTNPTIATVATAKAVAVGDLCGMSSGTLVKASDTTWNTDLATTQSDFRALFLGVSGQQKDANLARVFGNATDNVIRIDAGGIFTFDCASATFEVGDFVGPAKQTSGRSKSGQSFHRSNRHRQGCRAWHFHHPGQDSDSVCSESHRSSVLTHTTQGGFER